MAENRYKRLGKNTLIMFIGGAGSKLIGFFMLPFYTHFLSTVEYGISSIIATYSQLIMGMLSCCIAESIFIFPKDADKKGRQQYFTSGLSFLLMNYTICFTIFGILRITSVPLNIQGTFIDQIWWIFAFVTSNYFQSFFQQFTRSIDKLMVYSTTGIVHTIATAVFAILLIPRIGLAGYLWATVLSNISGAVYSFFLSGSWKYLSIRAYDKAHLIEMLKYSVPMIPNGLMWWLVNSMNRPVMENFLGLSAVGIYAVAAKFPSIIMMLINLFGSAWTISLLEEFKKPDFNYFFNRTLKFVTFICIIAGCVITLFSKFIIRVFADEAFFEAWQYVPVLTLGVIMQCMSGFVGGVFAAEKKSKYFFYSSLWGGISSLVLTFLCIKYWGLFGAGAAIFGSFLVMTIVRIIYAWKHINLFSIKYYVEMFLLYILLIVAVSMDAPIWGITACAVFVLLGMTFLNRNDLQYFQTLVTSKIRKKKN